MWLTIFCKSVKMAVLLSLHFYLKYSTYYLYMHLSRFNHVQLFVTLWTLARQTPWSMGFSRQEYWSGQPLPSPGNLPDLGIKSGSPSLQADSLPSESPGKPLCIFTEIQIKIGFNFFILQIRSGLNSRICGDKQSSILKGKPSGFVDGLDVARKGKREVKDNS